MLVLNFKPASIHRKNDPIHSFHFCSCRKLSLKDFTQKDDAAKAKPKVDILALRHRARLTGSQMKAHSFRVFSSTIPILQTHGNSEAILIFVERSNPIYYVRTETDNFFDDISTGDPRSSSVLYLVIVHTIFGQDAMHPLLSGHDCSTKVTITQCS